MRWLQELEADTRYALRRIFRAPVFTAAVVATLALAIGASLAIIMLIDRAVLRPIDAPDAERLVVLQRPVEIGGVESRRADLWSWAEYQQMLDLGTLESVAASSGWNAGAAADGSHDETARWLTVAIGSGRTDDLSALFVTPHYFQVLGLPPAAGRDLQAAADAGGDPLVAMISYRLWQTRFGGDSQAIGQSIRTGDRLVTIVGVTSPAFTGTRLGAPPDIVLPLAAAPHVLWAPIHASLPFWPVANLAIVGRLAPDAGPAQLEAELAARLASSRRATVVPLREALLPLGPRADLRLFLALLAGAVALTMIVGTTNVAGLLLARVDERRPKLAIRAALGAGRVRLARQLAVEVAILALAAGAAALLVARWIGDGFSAFALPGGVAVSALRSELDARTMIVAVALSAGVAFAVSAVSVFRVMRRDLAVETRRPRGSSSGGLTARLLLGMQVSLCVVLVFGAILFVRSVSAALRADAGFDHRNLTSITIRPPLYSTGLAARQEQVRAIPGVTASTSGPLPFVHTGHLSVGEVEVDQAPLTLPIPLAVFLVDAEYFTTLGRPVVRGRDFTPLDASGGPAVAIVNETAAAAFWTAMDPVGRQVGVRLENGRLEASVAGVVRDLDLAGLESGSGPALYVVRSSPELRALSEISSAARGAVSLQVRTRGDRASVLAAIDRAAADAGVAVARVTTIDDVVEAMLMPQRLGRALLAGLSATALLVTMIGVYGFVSGAVTARRREVGVRLALGASSSAVLYSTLRSTLVMVAVGLALGATAAWWAGGFAQRFVYGLGASDPASLATAVLLLGAVAIVAALVPALRVLRIDPVTVLRME